MLTNRYDWSFANDEFIFLIFVIVFDRDDSFISDFSAKDKHFFFAINFREESKHFFFFYQFFHRQQSIFQHFHCFFQIVKNDRKLNDVRRNFDYFFRESRNFREHFLFKLRKFSVDTNQFKKQKRDQSRRIVFMKRKRKRDDEKRKNLSFAAEINEWKVETLQSIKHYRVREFNRNNRIFENERKNFENQKNNFNYFFHRFNHRFDRFFLWLNDLFLFEIDLVNCSESDIRIRTIRYSSIEHRTKRTSFVLESRKVEYTFIFFFRQYKQKVSSFWLFKLYVLRVVLK